MKTLNDKIKKGIMWGGIVCAAAAVILIAIFCLSNYSSKEQAEEIITKSTLEKIIHVSELSTFEAVYNGVAEVMNQKNPEKVDYYVYYEAKVKAGIDFEKVEVDVDHNAKKISVIIPDIKINSVNVDIASLDYIFENEKANTGNVSEQAYKAAIEDVTEESSNETAIFELATQNAKNIIEALISPFVGQMDSEYELEIN